jgi:capsular exopolysaccharide synthesis family protein
MNLPGLEQVVIGSEITTEMEMLRSRSLAEDVARRLQLRLVVAAQTQVPRSRVLDSIDVAANADSATFLLEFVGGVVIARSGPGGPILARGTHGSRMSLPGVSFKAIARPQDYPLRLRLIPLNAAIEALRDAVKVTRVGGDANIVLVQGRGSDPELQRDIVNELCTGFIERRQSAERADARTRVSFLREQSDTLERQLRSAESALRQYRESAGIADIQVEASTQVTRLAQMQGERSTLDAERHALKELLDEVEAKAATTKPGEPSPYRRLIAFPTLLRNQAASELLRSLTVLENDRAQLLNRRTAEDPDVLILSRRIQEVDEQLRSIGVTYLEGLTGQIVSMDTTLRQFGAGLQAIPAKELRLAEMERAPKVLNQMYELVQSRLKEAEIAQAAIDPSVRIVDPAIAPDDPISPRPVVNLTVAILLGLALGLSTALVREWRDRTVHTRADVTRLTQLPVVGLIPRIPGMRRIGVRIRRRAPKRMRRETTPRQRHLPAPRPATGLAPVLSRVILPLFQQGPLSQAFSRLDTHLAFLRPESQLRVILLTSPLSGDGKTTTAANFAVAAARQGDRVILIDADLRRGILHRFFSDQRQFGLSDVLTGTVPLEQAVQSAPVGEEMALAWLGAGTPHARPELLLASDGMARLLDRLRSDYDLVIIDSAPVNLVVDPVLLAPRVDGVLLVARAGVTVDDALTYALEQLRSVRAPLIGAVLNDVDMRREVYYDSAYKYQGFGDPYYSMVRD